MVCERRVTESSAVATFRQVSVATTGATPPCRIRHEELRYRARVDVVEQFVLGKAADPSLCEDAVVMTEEYAAVVDGATDISGTSYDGLAGGRWAMAACVDAILGFPKGLDAHTAVAVLTREVAGRIGPETPPAERPSASVTIYSATRRQVWQVGDVGFAYAGLPVSVGQPRKRVDEIASSFRAAIIAAEAAAGNITMARPIQTDPGRTAVRALVARQGSLRNTTGPYGYAGVDGRPVPSALVGVHHVPEDVTELVMASDGYPAICGTLAESESVLARLLTLDPWCVHELRGTKGVLPGQVSFDDRAYLRIRL
jgi:hypothetical protein